MTEYFIKWIAMCLIVSIIYIAVRIPVLKKKNKKLFTVNELIAFCFVIYITSLLEILIIPNINITIIFEPNDIYFDCSAAGHFEEHLINMVPFATLKSQFETMIFGGKDRHVILNLLANFFVLMPLPIMINLSNRKIKGMYPLLISLATAITIEFLQYFVGRTVDIDDVILNMSGAVIGYIIYTIIKKILKTKNGSKKMNCSYTQC